MAMFQQYALRSFMADFNPLPTSESASPTMSFVQRRIAESLSEDNILRDLGDLSGRHPVIIGDVKVTLAAYCQIRDMWSFSMDSSADPVVPLVPLKYFTSEIRRARGEETIAIEIHPGLDEWGRPI